MTHKTYRDSCDRNIQRAKQAVSKSNWGIGDMATNVQHLSIGDIERVVATRENHMTQLYRERWYTLHKSCEYNHNNYGNGVKDTRNQTLTFEVVCTTIIIMPRGIP